MNNIKITITESSGHVDRELVKEPDGKGQYKKNTQNRFEEILGSKIG